jgi:hypothetical protein
MARRPGRQEIDGVQFVLSKVQQVEAWTPGG